VAAEVIDVIAGDCHVLRLEEEEGEVGAKGTDVLGMIVRSGLRPVIAGLAVGLTMSTLVGRVFGTQLVGVTMYDPTTLAATALLLTITAAIACWIPARRAARVDPLVALRYE
jgi:putative ABC transport system permease protein